MLDAQAIVGELEKAFRGPSWHGPSLSEVLRGVDARQAFARPVAGAHTIAELALHTAAWKAIVRRRAAGEPARQVPPEEDWPASPGPGADEWASCLTGLEREHELLLEAVRALQPEQLSRSLADETVASSLLGVAHHDLYHAGQVALLRRAGAPPSAG